VEQKHEGFAAALLAFPTLGIHPIVTSEKALANHAAANDASFGPLPTVAEDLKTRIEEAKGRAFAKRLGAARIALLALVYPVCIAGLVLTIVLMNQTHWDGTTRWPEYNAGVVIGWITYAIFQLHLALQLHWFRETVRRHEYDQFYARLVADAVPPARIKEISEARSKAWAEQRGQDFFGSIFGLILTPVFMLPFLAGRLRSALALHMKHEEQLLHTGASRKEIPE
jgi:hypothetical protein